MNVAGKITLVTGAARGGGCALCLVRAGADLAVHDPVADDDLPSTHREMPPS